MKLEFSRLCFEKQFNIKFHENPSTGSRAYPYGNWKVYVVSHTQRGWHTSKIFHTDRHDEANSRFSQFCERAYKDHRYSHEWDTIKNVWWCSCKAAIILIRLQLHLNLLDSVSEHTHVSNFMKIVRWEPKCSIRTDMTKLIVAFSNFANSPINSTVTVIISFHHAISKSISRNVSTHTQYQSDARTKKENWTDIQLCQLD